MARPRVVYAEGRSREVLHKGKENALSGYVTSYVLIPVIITQPEYPNHPVLHVQAPTHV